jgi:hypothetical protein
MRRVQIVEKPNETYSYAAVDQQTGEVLLRLRDRHALVALCERWGGLLKRSRKQGRDSKPLNVAGHIKVKHDRESVGPPSSSARGSARKDRILASELLTRQRSDVADYRVRPSPWPCSLARIKPSARCAPILS